jgi:predicted ABC-type ATPase
LPELHVLAGPNGSGKSTFTREVRSGERTIDYDIPPVINPDVIAQRLNPGIPDAAIIAAGREAVRERDAAIARGDSFAIETTLSGHGELGLIRTARLAGYSVTMTFVSVSSAEDSAWRVSERAREENRTVPLDVIYRRFPRSLENLAAVAPLLDRLDVYDNSQKALTKVAPLERGRIIAVSENVPAWAEGALREPLASWRDREVGRREADLRN